VIVTRDRPALLARCLAALSAAREQGLGLLVVDDGSTDARAVAAAAGEHGARLVRQAPAGVGAARNAGARAAGAEYVCFTDDDCVPQEGWAGRLVDRLAGGAGVVAGPTMESGGALAVALQLTADALVDADAAATGTTAFAPGSNFACRRSMLERFPLDESRPSLGAEDRDWCARLGQAGITIAYEAAAVVVHRREVTLGGFWRKNVRYGRGARRYRAHHERGRLGRPALYTALVRAGVERGPSVGAAVVCSQLAVSCGYVLEALGAGRAG
jgi:GT2 family glycosyltransferase